MGPNTKNDVDVLILDGISLIKVCSHTHIPLGDLFHA